MDYRRAKEHGSMNKYQELYFNAMDADTWKSYFTMIRDSDLIARLIGCDVAIVKAKRREMLSEVKL